MPRGKPGNSLLGAEGEGGGCCRVVDGSYLASPCPTATPARGLRCSAPVGGCDCPQGAPGAWWRRARAAEPLGDFLGWGHLCPWGTLLLGCCCGVWGILERAQHQTLLSRAAMRAWGQPKGLQAPLRAMGTNPFPPQGHDPALGHPGRGLPPCSSTGVTATLHPRGEACGEAERAGAGAGSALGTGAGGKGGNPGGGRGPRAAAAPSPGAALTRQLVVGAVQVPGVGQALLPAFAPHLLGRGRGDPRRGARAPPPGRGLGTPPPEPPPPPPPAPPLPAAAGRGQRSRELGTARHGSQERAAAAAGAGHGRPLPSRPSPPPPGSRRPGPAAAGKLRHGPGRWGGEGGERG